uniref:Uncharacterized protein n=1 Tax=Anguilla anguilla TaxID=7936 RepID=A0A0E9UF79_ANGAN
MIVSTTSRVKGKRDAKSKNRPFMAWAAQTQHSMKVSMLSLTR